MSNYDPQDRGRPGLPAVQKDFSKAAALPTGQGEGKAKSEQPGAALNREPSTRDLKAGAEYDRLSSRRAETHRNLNRDRGRDFGLG